VVLKGTYSLYISISEPINVKIGALGDIKFDKGCYVYVGSAFNSLLPRIIRHFKVSREDHRVIHWHIDYLLREKEVRIERVYVKVNGEKKECSLAEKALMYGVPIKKFGSSDCKCVSHLFRVDDYKFLEKSGLEEMTLESFLYF
jgi:Uri superfamily endonuclease